MNCDRVEFVGEGATPMFRQVVKMYFNTLDLPHNIDTRVILVTNTNITQPMEIHMKYSVKFFSTLVAVALSFGVAAQQDDGGGEAPDITTEQYKDWALRCGAKNTDEVTPCRLFQRLVLGESKQVVLQATVVMSGNNNDTPLIVFTVPLGLYLPFGVAVQIDNTEGFAIRIERCMPRGCTAILLLDDSMLTRFKAGNTAKITVREARDKDIDLNISLKGFSAGFKALQDSGKTG